MNGVCFRQKPYFKFWSWVFSGLALGSQALFHDAGRWQQDHFAQLYAPVSVLSTAKGAEAKLRCSVG